MSEDGPVFIDGPDAQEPQATITCPRCFMRSASPGDILHGYCGNCHEFTSKPGGSFDPRWPLPVDESTLEPFACPTCPWCGRPPAMALLGSAQVFCGNDDCRALTWNARMPAAEILRTTEEISLTREDGR